LRNPACGPRTEPEQQVAVSPKLAAAQPDVLRLAEEHLRSRPKRWPTRDEKAAPAFGGFS